MQDYVRELRDAVERGAVALLAISPEESSRRPGHDCWSPKEILGHLVDSAANNHQRFVRAQFQDDLVFPGYAQEEWVAVQRYEEAPWEDLVALWRTYNLHLARVMEAAPEEVRTRVREHHNLHEIGWRPPAADEPATLDGLMRDYVGHLKHHLRQILVAVPEI
jgi:hypothetical protein